MIYKSQTRRASERGSTLVEFALVAILFFTLFFGIVDFGRALYAYHFVGNAAREGTRYAMVRGNTCITLPDCNIQSAQIQTYLAGLASGLNSSQLTASTTWPIVANSPSICSTSNNQNAPGCTVQVSVTYPFNFIFPLMPTTTCTLGSPPVTANICMTSTSQMVISQ